MKYLGCDLHVNERGFFTYIALILGTILLLFWSVISTTMHTVVSMTHDEVSLTTMNYYAEGIIGCLLRTYSEQGITMPTGREVIYEQSEQSVVTYILTPPTPLNQKGDFRVAYRNKLTGQQVRYYVVFREENKSLEDRGGASHKENMYGVGDKKTLIVERVSRIQ